MLLLLLLLLSAAFASPLPPMWDETCSYTRDDVYNCLKNNVDINPKDGQITEQEIDEAFDRNLSWYLKWIMWLTNGAKVLQYCDYDKNGVITKRDFYMSNKTCLPDKRNWCTVQWFCERDARRRPRKMY